MSDEAKKKLSIARQGIVFSDEHKNKLSLAHIGKPSWNKGKKGFMAGEKHPLFGKPRSEETKKKISLATKGRKLPPRTKEWCAAISRGKIGGTRPPATEETKSKLSIGLKKYNSNPAIREKKSKEQKERFRDLEQRMNLSRKLKEIRSKPENRRKTSLSQSGNKSHFWKGGITQKNLLLRGSVDYKIWREAVFKRDNYTCIWCGDDKGGNLEADHIQTWSEYPELRFAIDNGRTLCESCHQKRHKKI